MERHDTPPPKPPPIRHVAARFAALPGVTTVALGGSHATLAADDRSDHDLYVFVPEPPPLAARAAIAAPHDPRPEIGNAFFGPGDEWTDARTGLRLDVVYWESTWIEDQLARVLDRHLPSVGYSTCFWYTVRNALPLVDRDGWFAALQAKAARPYPEPLRRAIVANNHPLLRTARSSFLHQIELALARDDPVGVQHRTTALLASYFDVLFALNRQPHPGEKRLLAHAHRLCPILPDEMEDQVVALIRADPGTVVARAHALIDALDANLAREGIVPATDPLQPEM
jgi:hypothetical protein